jgi:hypothetical protein
MPDVISKTLLRTVQSHAFEHLSFAQRETTNLHIDKHIYRKGEVIGPEFQMMNRRPTSGINAGTCSTRTRPASSCKKQRRVSRR